MKKDAKHKHVLHVTDLDSMEQAEKLIGGAPEELDDSALELVVGGLLRTCRP